MTLQIIGYLSQLVNDVLVDPPKNFMKINFKAIDAITFQPFYDQIQ